MSMKLLVLGLLIERDRHPYEIRQTIRERNWNAAFRVRDGSLYYAVDQMNADGLIEAAEVVPVAGDNRPDKTIYRITDKGKEAFHKLMYGQLGETAFPWHPFFPAMPFIRHGDAGEVGAYAERGLQACEERIARMRHVIALKSDIVPKGTTLLLQGILRFSECEREWLREVREAAKSGELMQPCPGYGCDGGK